MCFIYVFYYFQLHFCPKLFIPLGDLGLKHCLKCIKRFLNLFWIGSAGVLIKPDRESMEEAKDEAAGKEVLQPQRQIIKSRNKQKLVSSSKKD